MRTSLLSVLGLSLILGCSKETPNETPIAIAGQSGGGAGAAAGAAGMTGGVAGDTAGVAGQGGAGAGGDAGAGGMADGGADAGAMSDDPQTLAETGLYADAALTVLAEGVMEYSPQFALWSDTAEKRRFIWLPPGTQIDTTDMDYWLFPVGTKVWKEFTRDGKRIETRLLMKRADMDWFMASYAWTEDMTAAALVPRRGQLDALGTSHDIPSTRECGDCHQGQIDTVLGFSAIQLSHDGSAVNLQSIKAAGLLSAPPAVDAFVVPGNPTERAVIGMFHANCGQCHSQYGAGYDRNQMEMWLMVDTLGDLSQTATYQTAVSIPLDQDLSENLPGITHRVVPGQPAQSAVYLRMNVRDPQRLVAMPPIGTELVDTTDVTLVETWINSLPSIADGGVGDGG